MAVMLVRVFYGGSEVGKITTWNDQWYIEAAMCNWLTGEERFEILGYYPNMDTPYLVKQQFKEAEERYASWDS